MSLFILQNIIHYTLHFFFPGLVAFVFFKKEWKTVWIILLSTMLVDIDHLFAEPIFDPNRCSVGFSLSAFILRYSAVCFVVPIWKQNNKNYCPWFIAAYGSRFSGLFVVVND